MEMHTNALIKETSPYLLEHANDPVNWYPWKREAFEKAKKEDKPIFLSIGYSTCHWCHVMQKESFQDEVVAQILNKDYVCIKVDREERPDIDSTYMKISQMMNGSGGWPLTIIMGSDGRPFFSTTYLPKEERFGMPGIKDVLTQISKMWKNDRDRLNNVQEQVVKQLGVASQMKSGEKLGPETLNVAFKSLKREFDEVYGGFGSYPKFPMNNYLWFLLRYWKRTSNSNALEIVEKTIESIRAGGIYDQLRFGVHRYATDREWLVPHFEKMLYDQAMTAITCTELYRITKKDNYKEIAKEILEFVLQDLKGPYGAFYTGVDADSEGEEGAFYLWSEEEMSKVLDKEELELAMQIFKLKNVEGSKKEKSILHAASDQKMLSAGANPAYQKLMEKAGNVREKLLEARNGRVRPDVDSKILCDMNGLMIYALAYASSSFSDQRYLEHAKTAADFILNNMVANGQFLYHSYSGQKASVAGFLDDYVFLISGLIELYQASFETSYLSHALSLAEYLVKHFFDKNQGGFFFTSDLSEEILVREKPTYDSVVPSGNSAAALDFLLLARFTGNIKFEEYADRTISALGGEVAKHPSSYTSLLNGLSFAMGPSYEVVIVGDLSEAETKKMLGEINRRFIPEKVLMLKGDKLNKIAPFSQEMKRINNRATVYVCQNYACNAPTNSIEQMVKYLGG